MAQKSNIFRNVVSGERFSESADFRNAVVGVLRSFYKERRDFDQPQHDAAALPRPYAIKVKNNSGDGLPLYSIVGIGSPLHDPTDNIDSFLDRVTFESAAPSSEQPFAICQEPSPSEDIATAILHGISQVPIKITNVAHTFAAPIGGDYGKLTSSADTTSCEILWDNSGATTTLDGGIDDAQLTLDLGDTDWFVDGEQVILQIESEQIAVTWSYDAQGFTVDERGYNSTTPVAHADGIAVSIASGVVWAIARMNGSAGGGTSITSVDESIDVDTVTTPGTTDLMVMKATTSFALTGTITPPLITADQNDYDPTGLADATVLRLSSNATRNLTGIVGGFSGRILVLRNIGANQIVLKNQTGSSSVNQFRLPVFAAIAYDVTIPGGHTVVVQYDSSLSYWVLLCPGPTIVNGIPSPSITHEVGTTGTDHNIAVFGSSIIHNIPDAATTKRGLVTIGTQQFAGDKEFTGSVTIDGNLQVDGSINADFNLTVGLNATIDGTLTVTNDINDRGWITVESSDFNTALQRNLRILGGVWPDPIPRIGSYDNSSPFSLNGAELRFEDWGIVLSNTVSGGASNPAYGIKIGSGPPFAGITADIGNLAVKGGLITSSSLLVSVSQGGTGRTSLDAGKLMAGNGTSPVDSVTDTRIVSEKLENKVGTDRWVGYSIGSF